MAVDRIKMIDISSEFDINSLRALCSESPVKDRNRFQKKIGEDTHETYSWLSADETYTKWHKVAQRPIL